MQNPENELLAKEILVDRNRLVLASAKFDPSLPRALSFLRELNLIEIKNSRYRLLPAGHQLYLTLDADAEIFRFEKQILSSLESRLFTESYVDGIYRNG